MNISNVDIDLNSLFNLSYNFDALKLMLGNLAKNQTSMVDKINQLEEELNKIKKKDEELEKAVTQNQSMNDRKFKSVEIVLTNMKKGKDKKGDKQKDEKKKEKEQKSQKEEIKKETEEKGKSLEKEKIENVEEKTDGENKTKELPSEKQKEKTELTPLEIPDEENKKSSYNNNANNEDDNEEKNDEKKVSDEKTEEEKEEDDNEDEDYGNGNLFLSDNVELEELKKRVTELEKKIKNMELMKFSGSLSGSSEDLELQKAGLKSLNDKVEELVEKNRKLTEELEEMKVKVNDFNVYDLFKDCKTEGGNLDVSKVLIMNLENKVFKKIGIIDEKLRKNDEDIYKAKNDIVNLKNQNDVNNRAFANIKEDFKKIIEEIQNMNEENSNQLNDVENKLNEKINKLIKDFDENKKANKDLFDKIKEQIKKLEEKLLNSQNGSGSNDGNSSLSDNDLRFLKELNKKTADLEKNLKMLSSSLNLGEIKDEIKKIKEELDLKGSQQDFFDLNDKVNDHSLNISNIKDINEKLIEESTKAFSDINFIMKKIESLNSAVISLKQNDDGSLNNKSSLVDTTKFLEINSFNEFLRAYTKDKDRVDRDIDDLRRYLDELAEILKTKASEEDLKNLEGVLNGKIDELKILCNKRYADKIDTSKSIKYLDTQIKHIIEVYIKKMDKGDSWLLAKKPIGGFTCASCEAYIGELKDKEEYLAWNKYPVREPQDKAYRIGNGFSRMLNMLNLDVRGSYDNGDEENKMTSGNEKKGMNGNTSLPSIKPHRPEEGNTSLDGNTGEEYKTDKVNPNDPKVVKIYRKNKLNAIEIPKSSGSQ